MPSLVNFATGVPRITNRGLLIEESRTNKLTLFNANPADATGVFGYGGAVVSVENRPDLIAAAGLAAICTSGNVYKVVTTGFDSGANVLTASTGTTTHTVSAYVCTEAGLTAQVLFENAGGLAVIGQTASPDLTRVASTHTPAASTRMRVRANTPGTLYFILPQLEEGAFPTSPIVTVGAAATRAADIAALALALPVPATIYFEFENNVASPGGMPLFWDEGTETAGKIVLLKTSAAAMNLEIQDAGAGRIFLTSVAIAPGVNKVALRFADNNMIAACNGVLGAADAAGIVPTNLSRLRFSRTPFNGSVRALQVLPGLMTNSQLQALTA